MLTASLVSDLESGTAGLNPSSAVVVGDMLLFAADDGIHGTELWRSDGTGEGTFMVKDIAAGSSGSGVKFSNRFALDSPRDIVAAPIDGDLLFFANDQENGVGLWRSDGTTDGTQLVKIVHEAWTPHEISASDTHIVFRIHETLWLSDGTPDGTNIVGPGTSQHKYVLMGDQIVVLEHAERYVKADDGFYYAREMNGNGSNPIESVWFTDGNVFREVYDGSGQGDRRVVVRDLKHHNGLTYFALDRWGIVTSLSQELWVTDGSVDGTEKLTNGTWDWDVLFPLDDEMLFASGGGLFKTAGTPESVTHVFAGVQPDVRRRTATLSGRLYFTQ